MDTKKNLIINIGSSIVASILFIYCLEPALKLTGNYLSMLIEFVSSSTLDYIYSKVAIGKTDYSLDIYTIFLILISLSLLVFVILVKININTLNDEFKLGTGDDSIEQLKEKLREKEAELLKLEKRVKKHLFFSIISTGIFLIISFLYTSLENYKVNKIREFNINKQIIAPYVTPQRLLLIESKFCQVKTKLDYDNLYEEIVEIASKNEVFLREIN